jgi:hypothetical protein
LATLESERVRVSHSATDAIESARQQFKRHESFGRKRTGQRARAITREAEARIVRWVTEDEDDLLATLAQPIQAVSDQLSTNTAALLFRQHGQWSQSHRRHRTVAGLDQHSTEQDVSDDPLFTLSDERGKHSTFGSQAIDQIRFVGASERRLVE